MLFGHVAYGGSHDDALVGLQRTQANLNGEIATVAAPTLQLQAVSHRPRSRVGHIGATVLDVGRAQRVIDEHLDRLAEQSFARVAKHLLGTHVCQVDSALAVDDDHRVGGRLQQPTKARFARAGTAQPALVR